MVKSVAIYGAGLMLFSFYTNFIIQGITLWKFHVRKNQISAQQGAFEPYGVFEISRCFVYAIIFGGIFHFATLGWGRTVFFLWWGYPLILAGMVLLSIRAEDVTAIKRIPRLSFYASIYNIALKDKVKQAAFFTVPLAAYFISTAVFLSTGLWVLLKRM
jgi:hypothetical protein